MAKRVLGGVLLAGWLAACGSGGGSADSGPVEHEGTSLAPGAPGSAVTPTRSVHGGDGVEVRYQFVDTAAGMTLEAISGDQVQTLSCPTRSCSGYCDECAARACRASGQLAEACASLVRSCSDSCNCDSSAASGSPSSCGFPACSVQRPLCYVGPDGPAAVDEPSQPEPSPSEPGSGPGPDPAPASASSSSSGSSAANGGPAN